MLRSLALSFLALATTSLGAGVAPPTAEAEGSQSLVPLEVCFVPFGPQDRALLAIAERGSAYLYGATTRRLPARPLPRSTFYAPRKRYRADKLLDVLDAAAETLPKSYRCDVMVGITTRDISTTKGKHKDWGVLGLGSIGGRSAVVSSFRMKKRATRSMQKRRMASTVNHEIGHVLSAPHGGAPGCLMNDAQGTVKTIDAEHGLLCKESRMRIESHSGRPLPRHASFDWDYVLGI